eukprot:scaffold17516_cov134-Isochrysis_galbana.AAC.4
MEPRHQWPHRCRRPSSCRQCPQQRTKWGGPPRVEADDAVGLSVSAVAAAAADESGVAVDAAAAVPEMDTALTLPAGRMSLRLARVAGATAPSQAASSSGAVCQSPTEFRCPARVPNHLRSMRNEAS